MRQSTFNVLSYKIRTRLSGVAHNMKDLFRKTKYVNVFARTMFRGFVRMSKIEMLGNDSQSLRQFKLRRIQSIFCFCRDTHQGKGCEFCASGTPHSSCYRGYAFDNSCRTTALGVDTRPFCHSGGSHQVCPDSTEQLVPAGAVVHDHRGSMTVH